MTNSTDAAFDREGCRGKPLAHELPGLAEGRAYLDRVEAALQEAAADVTARLKRHRPALEHIARVLLDQREMDGPALVSLLADAVPAPDPGGESLLSQTGPDAPQAG